MKKIVITFICFFIILALIPVIAIDAPPKNSDDTPALPENTGISDKNCFIILNTSDGKIISVNDREFLYGALTYEMPPGFEEEALKAQAVAAYTFFCRKRLLQRASPDPSLNGADFSADLSSGEIYMNEEMRRKKLGSMYNESMAKIKKCCDSVYGKILTDSSGEPIEAAYHAISSGITEDSKDIFGNAQPYLIPTASPGDVFAADYITESQFTADEFRNRLRKSISGISFSGKPENYIKGLTKTSSGSVKTINICGKSLTGSQVRNIFGLRSANFELTFENNQFIFLVRGYGHGVGMSQYGAQSMAENGADYKEILFHYYGIRCT